MFRKEWHVVLTYLTYRRFWFVAAITAIFLYLGFRMVLSDIAKQEHWTSFVFVLGMPVLLFNDFVLHVVKWQFANPRARLIPGYLGPHLGVLAVIQGVLLLALPMSVAAMAGVPCWGPLAFVLVLGAGKVWTTGGNRGVLSWLVLMAVVFSAFSENGSDFWFLDQQRYLPLLIVLVAAGLAGVLGWFWRLVQLTEEMEDYMVTPLGGWHRPSRLESSEQRKFEGHAAGRKGIVSWISDRWHDRLPRPAKTPAARMALLDYGYSNIPLAGQALVAGCACGIYPADVSDAPIRGQIPAGLFNSDAHILHAGNAIVFHSDAAWKASGKDGRRVTLPAGAQSVHRRASLVLGKGASRDMARPPARPGVSHPLA